MENRMEFNINNEIYTNNNNNLLFDVVKRLENLLKETNLQIIIPKIKDIIIIMNKVIHNSEHLRKDIKDSDNIKEKFPNLELNANNNIINNNKQIKIYNNGRYEGQMLNGKREGKGIFYYNDGGRYEGNWKNNFKEGKGIDFFINGNRFEGNFKKGKREGKGIVYFNDGNIYEGDWKNDKREGKGIFYFIDGGRYEGDWKNDLKEGKGIDYFYNGNRYEGDFKKGKREGKGIFYFNNGDREMGNYLNDNPIGLHVTLRSNRDFFSRVYN